MTTSSVGMIEYNNQLIIYIVQTASAAYPDNHEIQHFKSITNSNF